jgi:hypothetical protein
MARVVKVIVVALIIGGIGTIAAAGIYWIGTYFLPDLKWLWAGLGFVASCFIGSCLGCYAAYTWEDLLW